MMTRHTKLIEIKAEEGKKPGRDEGKKFMIREMSPVQAEWWAFRVLQGIAAVDFDFGQLFARDENGYLQAPLAELARHGIKAIMSIEAEKAKPLLDEMMSCVTVPIAGGTERAMLPSDIEEVLTMFRLRKEILELHMGFFAIGEE